MSLPLQVEVDEIMGAEHARASIVKAAKLYEREYVAKNKHKFDHAPEALPPSKKDNDIDGEVGGPAEDA